MYWQHNAKSLQTVLVQSPDEWYLRAHVHAPTVLLSERWLEAAECARGALVDMMHSPTDTMEMLWDRVCAKSCSFSSCPQIRRREQIEFWRFSSALRKIPSK
jgi:hypothetical protein